MHTRSLIGAQLLKNQIPVTHAYIFKWEHRLSLAHIPILAYHQITKYAPPIELGNLAISAVQFERQMCYLYHHGYRCMSLIELLQSKGSKRFRQEKTFGLTFDDGYQDFLTLAYPILQRYGFSATVFLVTDLIGKQSDWEGKTGTPLLSWKQVKALHEKGISFGSHTCTHPWLSRLCNKQIWHELIASKKRLETELRQRIQILAYPYGESNNEIRRMAMTAGYTAAFGVDRGTIGQFNLWRRLCQTNDCLLIFIFKLSRWYYYLRWLKKESVVGQFLQAFKHRWLSDHSGISSPCCERHN